MLHKLWGINAYIQKTFILCQVVGHSIKVKLSQVKLRGEITMENVYNTGFSLLACAYSCFVHDSVVKTQMLRSL